MSRILKSDLLAPLVLFTYKRKDSLIATVESLKLNDLAIQTDLIVFSDGYKNLEDKQLVLSVREYLLTISGFKTITIIHSESNKGLAFSIINGVNEVINNYGKVIVVEDDLICAPNFLKFMNDSLMTYINRQDVFSVSGYSLDISIKSDFDAYFLPRGWSWGWATWYDRWNNVDWDLKDIDFFLKDKKRIKSFKNGGSDLYRMLKNQINGKIDSWAIRWLYHQFKINGVTLYPVISKVENQGFDEFATHTKGTGKRFKSKLDTKAIMDFKFPEMVFVRKIDLKKFQNKLSYLTRIKFKILDLINWISW